MGHRDEVASGKGAMRWTGSILFCIMLRAHTGRNDLRGLRIQISQERGRGQKGESASALRGSFGLCYTCYGSNSCLKRREGLGFSQDGLWLRCMGSFCLLLQALFQDALSKRASSTSEGLATPVMEQMATWPWGGFQKAQEGPKGQGL